MPLHALFASFNASSFNFSFPNIIMETPCFFFFFNLHLHESLFSSAFYFLNLCIYFCYISVTYKQQIIGFCFLILSVIFLT